MKNKLPSFAFLIFLCIHLTVFGLGESISLKKVFGDDLDADLEEKLGTSKQEALAWQTDARLYEVRLNISDAGKISWRFHWISNSGKNSLVLFSNSPSFRQSGDDPAVEEKPDLDIKATIGFNKIEEILQAQGVDLGALKVEDIMHFKLSYEKWKDPKAYYYYIFLTNGSQYYIHADTGEYKK